MYMPEWRHCLFTSGFSIGIESLQNRLLKVCYVPATSTGLPRVSFFFSFLLLLLRPLTVLMKQTRQAVRAVKQSIFLDVYDVASFSKRKRDWIKFGLWLRAYTKVRILTVSGRPKLVQQIFSSWIEKGNRKNSHKKFSRTIYTSDFEVRFAVS